VNTSRGRALSRFILTLILLALCYLLAAQTTPRLTTLDAVSGSAPLPNGIEARVGSATVRITAVRDDIVRVLISPEATMPEDSSWAVLPASRTHSVNVQPIQEEGAIGFRTQALDVRIERSPLRIVIRDLAGNVICADAPGRSVQFSLGGFTVYKAMPDDAHYYGLGDKPGSFDRRNQAFTLWNRDFGVQEWADPIYKSIPFFLSISQGRSYGLFLDNTWRSWFDFGKQARDAYAFGAEGGPLNYYVIYGPAPKQVVEGYAYLTGTPPLPPLWSLGFQQSRYSYYPDSELRRVANRLRSDKIPADTLYLDIDYQYKNRPFTVDPKNFPNFPGLVSDLRKQHFHLVTITDLHIAHIANAGYAPYDTGHAGDHFVKNPDGTEFVGVVWPGPAVFPDFTRAQTREWWGNLYREFVQDGVAGFWNDMNEPAVFDGPGSTMPLATVHRIEEPGFTTRTAPHTEIHNVFGMENLRATYEGLLKLRPNERPFALTRATYAGGQRYGFTWTGDNSASWNQMRLGTQQVLNLGLSGISFVGDDVGGFGGSPQPDLLTRWIELGVFKALYRDHSDKASLPQEVWVHGAEHEKFRRRYIETRYRLLPYIYTLAEEASRTGLPLTRPIFLEYPEVMAPSSPGFGPLDSEYLFGRDLLIAPPPFADRLDDYVVTYPPGDWYDFWTGEKMRPNPVPLNIVEIANAVANPPADAKRPEPTPIHPTLETLPVYARAGSIIPLQPLVQSTDEVPQGPLELRVYPGPDCHGSIYTDDGHTFRYQQGEYLRQEFKCKADANALTVSFGARQGTYVPWWKSFEVVVYGWPSKNAEVKFSGSGAALKTSYDESSHALHVTVADSGTEGELVIKRP